MTLKHSFKTALSGLRTNRSRSALTILGIVIGITAIMLVLSLGAGAQNLKNRSGYSGAATEWTI